MILNVGYVQIQNIVYNVIVNGFNQEIHVSLHVKDYFNSIYQMVIILTLPVNIVYNNVKMDIIVPLIHSKIILSYA